MHTTKARDKERHRLTDGYSQMYTVIQVFTSPLLHQHTSGVPGGDRLLHLLHLPHQPLVLLLGHLQVGAQRGQAGVPALQAALELHHGPLQLATALPQGADLGGQCALLLLTGLALRRLGPQLGVHRGQLGLELRLLLESLEGEDWRG